MSLKNSSDFVLFDGLESSNPIFHIHLVNRWFLWSYTFLVIVGGSLFNGCLAVRIFRRRSFSAILHLCMADIASLVFLAPYEISVLSTSPGVWTFPQLLCPIFLGLEVLLGTVVVYLIIVIDLHSVTLNHNHQNSLKIPLLTVWLLSMSLSVPDFIFGEVISPRVGFGVCCVPKGTAFLVGVFRLVVPVCLLIVGTAAVVIAQCRSERDHCSRLALALSLTYIATSVQRSILSVMYCLFPVLGPDAFKVPPLADVAHNPAGTLSLALVHYTLSAMRPLISWNVVSKLEVPSNLQFESAENNGIM